MGTSGSGGGPKGKTPLLPNWALPSGSPETPEEENQDGQEGSNDEQQDESSPLEQDNSPQPTQDLSSTKGYLTRIANGTKGASFKKFAKSYVSSSGGSKGATRGSRAGINTGGNYIGFWGGVSKNGFEQTLRNYNLSDCIGKSTEEVFARIADEIAPIGSTNDDAIARSAVMMAMEQLYNKLEDQGQDIDSLDSLDKDMLTETVLEFVSAYIFKKFVYEAGLALERNNLTETEAIDLENEMKTFIKEEVKSNFKKIDVTEIDLNSGQGQKIITEVFDLAYSTLEK
ncbi:hypothetical protein GCM10011531_07160 [Aquaticitalea lipolytica]|uniref:Uncharacterized protein n=1 Tax=Aquaticitalea lipolytica TaxID=1247562 RepID=A0A8J2TPF5_9FLAO|nr:Qat anti-phage system associated protein QatB [Aquaticitalea lipolytica]GFZ79796.1 hypothetical protein GCM10011531_07160 [Aquaticitalea lipolytica]